MTMQDKIDRFEALISKLGSVAVAFSGGADSTLLLAECVRVLGREHVLAVTADSPTLPRAELAEAKVLAGELGARHAVIETEELHDERFATNTADRCYYCKHELFERIGLMSEQYGFAHVVYGATADDLGDYRPGMRAAQEAGAVAPLLEAGFTKGDVRELSRRLDLRTWDKPAMACLSSRIPYGTPIRSDELLMVERGEEFLRQLGFRQVRVRHHGPIARIEIEARELPRLTSEPARHQVEAYLKELGFSYVAVDLSGRYYLVFEADFPSAKIGQFDSELVEDFWQATAANCLCNLHVIVHHGRNSHHVSEAIFKAAARALRMAVEIDPRTTGVPSTKGTLTG